MCQLCEQYNLITGLDRGPSPEIALGGPATATTIPTSGNTYLNAILWGGWKFTSGTPTTTVSYYFDASGAGGAWQGFEKAAYQAALQSWANVANLAFVETNDINQANMVEHKETDASLGVNVLGAHETPESLPQFGDEFGWYNAQASSWTAAGLQVGGDGFYTLVHELGHALGLAHTHDNGGGSGIFPGVTDPASFGNNNLNQGIYTVMSYNSGFPSQFGTAPLTYGNVAGPSAFDIAAVQHLYGANTTYHAGDDTYVIPDVNAAGTYWTAIWDAGGVDWIVYNGSKNVKIDLTAATLDNTSTGGGVASFADGIMGGFTIANGVVIEKARGGSGNDIINGNNANNTVHGGNGKDTIKGFDGVDRLNGQGGDDTVHGGNGEDSLYGESGNDRMNGQAHSDWLWGGLGNDQLYGEAGTDRLWGQEDQDYLVGGDGNDFLYGDAGNDFLDGGKGVDELTGGTGDDKFYFRPGNGTETILDFHNTVGDNDAIALQGTGLTTFDAVMAVTTNVTGGTLITFNAQDSIFMANATKESLTAGDFIFI